MGVEEAGSKKVFRWTEFLVLLGLGLRVFHFLRNPSVWHDEAALVLNVIGKSFRDLLGPLYFSEAAPPLFLWAEKAVTLGLGDGTFAFRALPFLSSCLALVLFVPVARRILRPEAVPWAVLLFACSDHVLWHACEAKPYSVDILAAVGLLVVFCFTRAWSLERQLAVYTILAPGLIFLVYPGCFLYGGLLIVFLWTIRHVRKTSVWVSYCCLALTVAASFAILYLGPIRAQHDVSINNCWDEMHKFPCWQRPWTVPWWTVTASLDVFRYCSEPAGQILAPLAAIGTVCLWKRGLRSFVAFLVLPLLLTLVAAYLRKYPYGGARIVIYAAPALLLLVAEGVPPSLAWLQDRARFAPLFLIAFLLLPGVKAFHRMIVPWDRIDFAKATAYVLKHRQPQDAVRGNTWEDLYYFRSLGPAFIPPYQSYQGFPGARLWLMVSGGTTEDRQRAFKALRPSGEWHILKQREFPQTIIALHQYSGPGASGR